MTTTLNKLPVTRCVLVTPQVGAWVADVEVAITSMVTTDQITNVPAQGDKVTLIIDSLSLAGTITYADQRINGILSAKVIGGNKGGFAALPGANNFTGASIQLIASTLLSSVGESLSTTLSNSSILQNMLPAWQTFGDRTMAEEMTQLATQIGCSWRVDPATGQAFFVQDTFSSAAMMPTSAVVESVSEAGFSTWLCPAIDLIPVPGTTDTNGNDIVEVLFDIDEQATRVQLRSVSLESLLGNTADERSIELNVSYGAQVTSQDANGAFSLNPDILSIKGQGLQSVKSFPGPGVTQQVAPGTNVLMAFRNGDPSKPYVFAFDGTPPQKLEFEATGQITVGKMGGGVAVGSAPQALAFADAVTALKSALNTFSQTISVASPPTTLPTVVTFCATVIEAAAALQSAIGSLPTIPTEELTGT